jgi:hypothetical protein
MIRKLEQKTKERCQKIFLCKQDYKALEPFIGRCFRASPVNQTILGKLLGK